MKRLIPFVALACVAATCGVRTGTVIPSEVRVDAAGAPPDGVDSTDADMCIAPNGTVYVVWSDPRPNDADFTTNIWLNRKLGGGERDQGWLPTAIRVNQIADTNAINPKVACDNDAVHVVWEDTRDGEIEAHQIYYNTSRSQGDDWYYGIDLLIETDVDGRSNSFQPQIVLGGASVNIVWYDDLYGSYDILYRRSPNQGLDWPTAPKRIDSTAAGSSYSTKVKMATVNNGDIVYIVWEDARALSGKTDIYFSRSLDQGNTFSADVALDVDGPQDLGEGNSFTPQIAADGDHVYVVWHDDRNGAGNDVYMVHSGDQGFSWNTPSRAEQSDPPGANQSLYPRLCVSGDTAHVAWHDDKDGGFLRAYYNRAVAGAWQGNERRLDVHKPEREALNSRLPVVACAGQDVVVAWHDHVDDVDIAGYDDLYYNYSRDGGLTWMPERDTRRLDSIAAGTSYKRSLGLQLFGEEIRAVWTDGRNGSLDVFYQQLAIGENAPLVEVETE